MVVVIYLTTLTLTKSFNRVMTKKYHYGRGERKAERDIDDFLQALHRTSEVSILEELRALSHDA